MADLHTVTDDTFDTEVLQAQRPVLVDFTASWCGPCKAVAPVLRDLKEEYEGEIDIVAIDIDQNPVLTERFVVRAVPTFMMFRDGEMFERMTGPATRSGFTALFDRSLA